MSTLFREPNDEVITSLFDINQLEPGRYRVRRVCVMDNSSGDSSYIIEYGDKQIEVKPPQKTLAKYGSGLCSAVMKQLPNGAVYLIKRGSNVYEFVSQREVPTLYNPPRKISRAVTPYPIES